MAAPTTRDALLAALPRGRRNATSVPALCRELAVSNRELRALIEELVTEQHVPVCTLPTSHGVWLAESAEEVEEAAGQLHSRAMSLLDRCRALRLAGESIAWSPTLFEL